jgi:hypothetical protein
MSSASQIGLPPMRSKSLREEEVFVAESPTIETRMDQPYTAIPVSVRIEELGSVVPPLTGRVFEWLAAQDIDPVGPPF